MSNTKLFALGNGCCIVGTALICVGDHRPGAVWMSTVAVGVAAAVFGLSVLRYLLFKGMKRKGA